MVLIETCHKNYPRRLDRLLVMGTLSVWFSKVHKLSVMKKFETSPRMTGNIFFLRVKVLLCWEVCGIKQHVDSVQGGKDGLYSLQILNMCTRCCMCVWNQACDFCLCCMRSSNPPRWIWTLLNIDTAPVLVRLPYCLSLPCPLSFLLPSSSLAYIFSSHPVCCLSPPTPPLYLLCSLCLLLFMYFSSFSLWWPVSSPRWGVQ